MSAERSKSDELRLGAQYELGAALFHQGEVSSARSIAEDGLRATRALGLVQIEALFVNLLSLVIEQQGDLVKSLCAMREALTVAR